MVKLGKTNKEAKLLKEFISTPKGVYKITKKEIDILDAFCKNPIKNVDFKGLKFVIWGKSNRALFNALKKLANLNVLVTKRLGRTISYSINFQNPLAITMLSFIEGLNSRNKKNLNYRLIDSILEEIESPYLSLVITGSYVEEKETKNSDLDVVAIIPDCEDKRVMNNYLKNKGQLSTPEIHPYVFSVSEFYKMLINKEENYGKEIYRKRIVIYGAEAFYKIAKRAIENGFQG